MPAIIAGILFEQTRQIKPVYHAIFYDINIIFKLKGNDIAA